MDRNAISFLALMAFILIATFVYAYIKIRKIKKANNEFAIKRKSGSKNYLIWVYRFYQKVPFLNHVFLKVKASVTRAYPADSISINKKVSEILLKTTIMGVAGVILSLIVAGNDVYYMLIGLTLTYVILNARISGVLTRLNEKILYQFGLLLTKLRHRYHEEPIIDTALNSTLDEIPYEIRLHTQRIHDIVINPNLNEKVEEYIGTEPNAFVLMFLSLCASIKEFGDKKMEDGTSLFLNDLNYLKEEVNDEIIGVRQNKAAFRLIPAVVLAPVLLTKPLEVWAKNNLEGIDNYYSSAVGICSLVGIFVVSIFIYKLVCILRDDAQTEQVDSNIWSKLAAYPAIEVILTKVVNKNYTKYKRYNDMAKGMGDHTGKNAFLLKRCFFAVSSCVVTLLIMIATTITLRYTTINNWDDSFKDVIAPSDAYAAAMEDTARDYTHVYKHDRRISDEEYRESLIEEISTSSEITNKEYAGYVADEVIARLNKYNNTYFKWYQLLISLLVGVIGFYIPVLYLSYKQSVIELKKEEEVVRFQSLMLILMHIDGITIDIILEWMERFSYCFKESISDCRTQSSKGQAAIEDMKDAESFEPFKDFCDNLLAIDRVGVTKAFDEIQVDRAYYLKKRQEDRIENLSKKVAKAHRIMFIPPIATIVFYLVVPMGVYAVNMLATFKEFLF